MKSQQGWAEFSSLERTYKARPLEERTTENVTTKLSRRFFIGQAISQKSKNPQGGMYGRVLRDSGEGSVHVLTKSGAQVFCKREFIELHARSVKADA